MRLEVGTFGGASAMPLLVARELGLFERAGLEVTLHATFDSAQLRDGLRDGSRPIVHLAPDNVIAWADAGDLPVRAWLGGSGGPISLLAGTATHVAELRGARIGVDSPRSGFAPILTQLLRSGGVEPGEVELVSLGATRLRFAALQAAEVEATMLTLPWSTLASGRGATILGDHTSVAAGLVTSCAAASIAWLETHTSAAAAYADVIDAAVAWMRTPGNRARTEALLAADMRLEPAVAALVLTEMLDERLGWPAAARLGGAELRPNWRLRAQAFGEPAAPPEAYVYVLPRT